MAKKKKQQQQTVSKTHTEGKTVAPRVTQVYSTFKETELLSELSDRILRSNTPDYMELKRKGSHHPVFVYGTLKQGFHNHDILKDSDYLGRGLTRLSKWELRNSPGGSFPIMMDVGVSAAFNAKISGEVYAVPIRSMLDLDDLEMNGRMYERKLVWVSLKDQIYKTHKGDKNPNLQVWAYVGKPEYWSRSGECPRAPYTIGTDDKRVFDWKDKSRETADCYHEYINRQFDGHYPFNDSIPWD